MPKKFRNWLRLSSDFLTALQLAWQYSRKVPSLYLHCIILIGIWFSTLAFNSSYCRLDVFRNTQTFYSLVFCTISCHKLVWGHWSISLSFRKMSYSVVPFDLWTVAKSELIPYRNISKRTVSGAPHLHQAPNTIQWKSDIWFLNTEMWSNQCLHFL